MDTKNIYGNPTMVMPGQNTLKTLEVRKQYLLKKLQSNLIGNDKADLDRYSYLIKEVRALEKTMKFIKWLTDNSEDDMVKNIVERYKTENELSEITIN
jgi:hypothetical protein